MSQFAANSTLEKHPRKWVTAVVAAHIVLAILASAINSYLLQLRIDEFVASAGDLVIHATEGFQAGQIVLIACWGAFAGQRWLLRIPRFVTFCAWGVLATALGILLVEGETAKRLAEEHAAYMLLQISVPVVVLFVVGTVSAKRFRFRDGIDRDRAWQFGTKSLLLLTAEAAVILALARVVIPGNFSPEEFWVGLTGNRASELLPAAVSVTVLPSLLVAFTSRPPWRSYLALFGYILVPSFLLAYYEYVGLGYILDFVGGTTSWSLFGLSCLYSLVRHVAAAATILFTFYLLRRIGYDFRRRDEGPRGRSSSSNACNSAASASA